MTTTKRKMIPFILALSSLLVAFCARASESMPDFEAELRLLETEQLAREEAQMRAVDAVSDVITDEVQTNQAATERNSPSLIPPTPEQKPSTTLKPRRIRSR